MVSQSQLAGNIIEKAKHFGASMAGIASIEDLKESPSHLIYPQMESYNGVGASDVADGINPGEIFWPEGAKSAVIIAVEHNAVEPELDWWDGKGTPGNRILIRINKALIQWLEESCNIKTYKTPYYIEKGGIFLKDAAVLAGLGCIGKSNLLVTPELGPRVRIRALLLNEELEPTGPIDFDPCSDCGEICKEACPVKAFDSSIYTPDKIGISSLPSRDGCYDRFSCNNQMEKDMEDAGMEDQSISCIKYCRLCELECMAGKK